MALSNKTSRYIRKCIRIIFIAVQFYVGFVFGPSFLVSFFHFCNHLAEEAIACCFYNVL